MPTANNTTTLNQRRDWDFTVIEKDVAIPLDNEEAVRETNQEGVTTYEGLCDIAERYKAIVREDTGQVFYIGSRSYQPVMHRIVLGPIIAHFAQNQQNVRSVIKSVNHGAKVFADFYSPDTIVINREGYRGGIRIVNSLDGTFRLVIEGIIFRERNNSTLLLSEFLSKFERRHILGQFNNRDFARIAADTVRTVGERLTHMISMSDIAVSRIAFEAILQRIDMPVKYKKLALDIWDTPQIIEIERADNAWAVLHIFGYLGTHELTRTLNDEAVYRWQKNVDHVLSKHLLTQEQMQVLQNLQQQVRRPEPICATSSTPRPRGYDDTNYD